MMAQQWLDCSRQPWETPYEWDKNTTLLIHMDELVDGDYPMQNIENEAEDFYFTGVHKTQAV